MIIDQEEILTTDDNIIHLPAREGLNEFDQRVVALVEGLLQDFNDAREVVVRDGLMVRDDRGELQENPAALAQRRASAELRGWVKERPDLFGPRQQNPASSAHSKLNRYRKNA